MTGSMPLSGTLWRHYKGHLYRVVGSALHSETTEPLVLYQSAHGDQTIWARPVSMWHNIVSIGDREVHRFTFTPG